MPFFTNRMNPEEKALLEENLKLSEENNKILKRLNRQANMAYVWGFVKIAVIIVPIIAGYLYLQPYISQAVDNYQNMRELLKI